ncbi:MAG TPA: hypothetical protein VKZ18_19770 [Polyangia bacterium]|nr:hypothetical protein [Polyangia bacterium]
MRTHRLADIIPIVPGRGFHLPLPTTVAPGPVRSPRGVAAAISGGLLFVAIVALSQLDLGGKIRDLPPAARGDVFRRSLDDVQASCTLASARDGLLREHCLAQARFVLLFPECDAHCRALASSILPHARR